MTGRGVEGDSVELDTVVLRVHGSAADADVTVHLGTCSPGHLYGDPYKALARANVEPWVVDGLGLYVSGPESRG
jgi:methionine aminopeptidase